MIKKIALYARVSTTKKKDSSFLKPEQSRIEELKQNPENQLLKLREYAKSHNYEIYKEYVDRASGRKSDRPALKELMDDASQRLFDLVAVVRLDRFGRSARNLTNNLFFLNNLKIGFVCTEQPISILPDQDDPMGKFLLTVLSAVAELELDLITERINDGINRAKLEGKKLGRPFAGLEKRRGTDAHLITADEIIRRLNEGMTRREIMRDLHISSPTYYRILKRNGQNGGENLCANR